MTNETTSCFDLGEVGRRWARQCLERSVCLGPLLLQELDIETGKATLLGGHGEPPHDDEQRLWESVSHLDILDRYNSVVAVRELLQSLNSTRGGIAVVVENDLLLPRDEYTQTLVTSQRAIVAGGTVFHIHGISSLVREDYLEDALTEGIDHPLNAFIVRADTAQNFVDLVERKDGHTLASALFGTIHSVYDNEGYVAWIKAE